MSWLDSVSPKSPSAGSTAPAFGAQPIVLAQLGALSPLWMLFMGASSLGMAYWGMSRWMTLAVPEKVAAPVVRLRLVKSIPRPEASTAPVISTPAPVAEATAELKAFEPQPQPPQEAQAEPEAAAPAAEKAAPKPARAKMAPAVKAEPAKPAPTPPKVSKPAAAAKARAIDAPALKPATGRKARAAKPADEA